MVAISRPWYNCSYTMAAKPIKSLELHYTMMQFLIKTVTQFVWVPCGLSKIKYGRGRRELFRVSFRFQVCFALDTTKLLSQGDTFIQLKPEQRTALRTNVHKHRAKSRILGHAQNIVFIALWFVGRYYRLNKHGVVRFSKSRPNF